MKKRLFIALGIGLLILILGTALYVYRPQALYSLNKSVPAERSRAEVWHAQDVPNWTLVRGQELVYDLNYRGSGRFPGQHEQAFTFALQGTLRMLVLSEEADTYRVWLSLQTEGTQTLQQVPAAMRASLQKSWTEGIGARLAGRGFHLAPLIGKGVDPTVAQFWQGLADRLQVDLPTVMSAPIWEQQETMSGGTVVARYEIDASFAAAPMLGEKIYLQKSFDAVPMPQKKLSGESLILLQPRFEGINQLEAESREVQELNGQSWAADSTVKLRWQKQNMLDETQVASLDAKWGKTRNDRAVSSQELAIQKAALGSLDLDGLWALVNQPGSQNSQELYLKLKAWIYLHPDEVKQLLERLKGMDEGDPALKMGIRALAAAGRPEAQDALVDLLDQRKTDVPLARKIITTLGFAPEPTVKSQQALMEISQGSDDTPVRRSSRLALGIIAQRLSQDADPEAQKRADELEALALKQLRVASGLSAIKDALAVLGNCGPTRIEDLNPWLQHPDPSIRGQAFFALRYARPKNTPDYLVSHYPAEESAEVRRQIIQAISLRNPDGVWFPAVETLLTFTVPDEDKIVLAKTLTGTVRQHKEESLKILARLLENTQDAAVRAHLAKYQETAKNLVAF